LSASRLVEATKAIANFRTCVASERCKIHVKLRGAVAAGCGISAGYAARKILAT